MQLLGVAAIAAGGWWFSPGLGLLLAGVGLVGIGTLAEASTGLGKGT